MKTRLEQVLEHYLNGREIIVWGTPTRRLLRALNGYNFKFVDSINPQQHYVVALNKDDLSDFLSDEQSASFKHVYDYLTFEDEGGELPIERMCYNTHIGRQTYFGEGVIKACKNEWLKSIGSDVYIGANAFINASTVTSIGDGAIIGSGAVVLEDVPPFAVVVGVPAKIKRYRFSDEMIEALLRVKWWNWTVEEINKNADVLMSPELFMKKYANL